MQVDLRQRCSEVHRWVQAHFDGSIRAQDERGMRQHLADCQGCCDLYERHRVLFQLDPKASSPQARLARGLGLAPSRVSRRPWRIAVPAMVAMALALAWVGVPSEPRPTGFVARGGPVTAFHIYRMGAQPALLRQIASSDELAFAYENGAGYRFLMIFGIDETRRIYWYHPAWRRADQNPRALAIEGKQGLQELKEAISHSYRGEALEVVAVFSNARLDVRRLEALLRRVGLKRLKAMLPAGSRIFVKELRVRHTPRKPRTAP